MSGRPTRVAGPLHNLVLAIDHGDAQASSSSTFHLFSTQESELAGPAKTFGRDVVSRGGSVLRSPTKRMRQSASLTPSPQKEIRMRPAPKLSQWNLRLCQQVEEDATATKSTNGQAGASSSQQAGASSETETESDDDRDSPTEQRKLAKGKAKEAAPSQSQARGSQSASPDITRAPSKKRVTRSAWYSAVIDAESAEDIFGEQVETPSRHDKQGSPSSSVWPSVEVRIKEAWDRSAVDVAVSDRGKAADGTYSSLRVVFGASASDDGDVKGIAGKSKTSGPIYVKLDRISSADELNEATSASIELMQALGVLTTRTQQLTTERNEQRILFEGGRKKKAKDASQSTTNVGRIRRQLVDDGGFEGEEDEAEGA